MLILLSKLILFLISLFSGYNWCGYLFIYLKNLTNFPEKAFNPLKFFIARYLRYFLAINFFSVNNFFCFGWLHWLLG